MPHKLADTPPNAESPEVVAVRRLLLPRGQDWVPPPRLSWTGQMWVGCGTEVSYPNDGQVWLDLDRPGWWFVSRTRWVMDCLSRASRPGAIWDIGGGIGIMADLLESAGSPPVVVVEPLRASAEVAARHRPNVFAAKLEDVGLAKGSLPAASLFDVLEHVPQPVPLLRVIRDLMDARSPLLVTVPAHPRLWSRIDVLSGHHRRYTVESLERELRAGGFRVAHIRHIFTSLMPAAWLARRLPRSTPDEIVLAHEREMLQPNWALDRVLQAVMGIERMAARFVRIPAGTSIVALAFPNASD